MQVDRTPQAGETTAETTRPRSGRGRGVWWVVAGIIACAGVILAFDRSALDQTLAALRHLRWGWVALGAVVEGLSMVAAAVGHRRLLAEGGRRIGLSSVLGVAFAGSAIASTVPFGGTQMAIAYSFRQYQRRGVEVAVAGWALAVAWMLVNLSLALVLATGAITSGNLLAAAAGVVTSVVFLVPPIAVLLALRYPGVRASVSRVAEALADRARRRFGRPSGDAPAGLARILERMSELRIPFRTSVAVFVFYLLFWAGDIACMVFAIRSVGAPIPWHGLLLAYGAGITAGSLGLTPGGIGVVEAAMSAALVASGLRTGEALSSVLVYRLVSFWLVLAAGWVVMAFVARTAGGGLHATAPEGQPAAAVQAEPAPAAEAEPAPAAQMEPAPAAPGAPVLS
jgi:uncharacterized protein (TIRG00374 family)